MAKSKMNRLKSVFFILIISIVASNSIIQFIETVTKNYGLALFLFFLIAALVDAEIVGWFK